MSITISPLWHLQTTRVSECGRYRIKTVAINEDSSNDPGPLWVVIPSDQHLTASPKQLGMYDGYLPRSARLIRQDRKFASTISRVHVDSAHNV
ncbi:hypothetical protein BS17DRAFT_854218, partial [Gyrodon lividus]